MSNLNGMRDLVDGLIADYERPRVKLDPGNGAFQVKTLLAMAEWAMKQQPIQPGDEVYVKDAKIDSIEPGSGWYYHREEMRHGPFPVQDIGYNAKYDYWYADVMMNNRLFMMNVTGLEKEKSE